MVVYAVVSVHYNNNNTRFLCSALTVSISLLTGRLSFSIDPLSSAPWRIDHTQRNGGPTNQVRHACVYAWCVRQSCAERHWRGSRVLAQTRVVGRA